MKKRKIILFPKPNFIWTLSTTLLCSIRVDTRGYPYHFYSKRLIDEMANKPFMSAVTCVQHNIVFEKVSANFPTLVVFVCLAPPLAQKAARSHCSHRPEQKQLWSWERRAEIKGHRRPSVRAPANSWDATAGCGLSTKLLLQRLSTPDG